MTALEAGEVSIRLATAADEKSLLAWRNHPSVRATSRDSQLISSDVHQRWLQGVLADESRCLLIGETGGDPLGVVRFDLDRDTAEVSIYLVPDRQGRGLGGSLLLAAEAWLMERRPGIAHLEAHVLDDNRASHRLFSACGYGRDAGRYTKRIPPPAR
jgi:RimJ/RimL family protein N-acetyltransferase